MQVLAAQDMQQQSQPQPSFDAELQQQSEYLRLHNMQQQLQEQQWQLQAQHQQPQVPPEHAETAMQQWIGMSTGELGSGTRIASCPWPLSVPCVVSPTLSSFRAMHLLCPSTLDMRCKLEELFQSNSTRPPHP